MIKWSVLRNYLNVKLVPKLKTNKLLKLLLANMKANSSIFLIGNGRDSTKQVKNALFSFWFLELRVENQICCIN